MLWIKLIYHKLKAAITWTYRTVKNYITYLWNLSVVAGLHIQVLLSRWHAPLRIKLLYKAYTKFLFFDMLFTAIGELYEGKKDAAWMRLVDWVWDTFGWMDEYFEKLNNDVARIVGMSFLLHFHFAIPMWIWERHFVPLAVASIYLHKMCFQLEDTEDLPDGTNDVIRLFGIVQAWEIPVLMWLSTPNTNTSYFMIPFFGYAIYWISWEDPENRWTYSNDVMRLVVVFIVLLGWLPFGRVLFAFPNPFHSLIYFLMTVLWSLFCKVRWLWFLNFWPLHLIYKLYMSWSVEHWALPYLTIFNVF